MIFGIGVKILGWVLPLVLGPIVYVVARSALNAHTAIDDLPPILKRIAVGALGIAITVAAQALGVVLPPECVDAASRECATALNAPAVVQGVTVALVAIIMHALKKSNPNT